MEVVNAGEDCHATTCNEDGQYDTGEELGATGSNTDMAIIHPQMSPV
jgi:hypothetical protein